MMDYTTTAEESCSLLSFRIRCPRSRKRAVRADQEKRLIKLDRELSKLVAENSFRNAEYVPLDPPIQRGFIRTFVLRDDVAALPSAPFYQAILDKINTQLVHPDRQFLKKARKRGKKKLPIPQFLQEPDHADFRKLGFTDKEARLFYLGPPSRHHLNDRRDVWKFSDPWRFRLQIRPNLITRQKVEYIAVEKRIKEIRNFLNGHFLLGELCRLKGDSFEWWRRESSWPRKQRKTTRQWLMELEKENLY